ncbi:PH domain-containing protein [Bacillus sp. CLL-7-23]|uniref:PH domain-containing protein n=1 Tax=Bacillus changyiensis TaxID=3004103 RepID=A0ABT4X0D0_9BACI|nr:PH domain-containing protein [Bacillus changyiensis]MDA7025749.1 PH domain-containing protein [Bacillus changyiensis]
MFLIVTVLLVVFGVFFFTIFLNTRYFITENCLVLKFGLSKTEIPLVDIVTIKESDQYGTAERVDHRIGIPYGQPDRVVIKTKTNNYLVFLNGSHLLMNKFKDANIY